MTVAIRRAEASDLAALAGIENAADRILVDLLAPPSWPAAPDGEARASVPGFILVAESADGQLVGGRLVEGGLVEGHLIARRLVGFAHVTEPDGADGVAHLEQLSVVPAHSRQGYGRSLVEAAAEQARQRGHRRMTLRTFADVPWNAPFYARIGFIEERPVTPFHQALVLSEEAIGLHRYGRRIQMGLQLGGDDRIG